MIKSYDKNNEAVKLIKQAIDISANGEAIHDKLSRSAHMKGFQGFKRWHRMQSGDDRCHRIKLQHYVIDMFGENLEPLWDYVLIEPIDLKDHLEKYLDWEIFVYEETNRIANELVIKGYNHEAEEVSDCISGVVKEIEKIRRWIEAYSMVNWDMTYILLMDKKLHDKCKEKEG